MIVHLVAPGATPAPVILLDLNWTFVENAREAYRLPHTYNVAAERYRMWMLPFLCAHEVVLITVRPERLKASTLDRFEALCGWRPAMACFNPWRLAAPACKDRHLVETVFPRFGSPQAGRYLALESNAKTRVMYAGYGIPAMTQQELSGALAE